jgi:hypothetical protein
LFTPELDFELRVVLSLPQNYPGQIQLYLHPGFNLAQTFLSPSIFDISAIIMSEKKTEQIREI